MKKIHLSAPAHGLVCRKPSLRGDKHDLMSVTITSLAPASPLPLVQPQSLLQASCCCTSFLHHSPKLEINQCNNQLRFQLSYVTTMFIKSTIAAQVSGLKSISGARDYCRLPGSSVVWWCPSRLDAAAGLPTCWGSSDHLT